jgi:GTP-binding protein
VLKFIDEARIECKAGDGGDGAIAFRREKYIPNGGPAGGDGGRGGDVIFVSDSNLTTLLDFQYTQHHKARNGEKGGGSDCNGRGAEDLVVRMPVGTRVKDAESGEVLKEFDADGERWIACHGGKGGLGNMNFATSTRQAPRFAEPGAPGERRVIQLELRLLADVGLLGFPNAGKSTLISHVSRARPKVADYPFTTLVPHLGVVAYREDRSFVMADIPGIIEGAHDGAGLGHTFLKHVEKCKVLIHLLDCSAEGEGRDPLADLEVLNRELKLYSKELSKKPQIIAANKADIPESRERAEKFAKQMARKNKQVHVISAATGEGLKELLNDVAKVLYAKPEKVKAKSPAPAEAKVKVKATSPAPAKAKVKVKVQATSPALAKAKEMAKAKAKAAKRAS